MNDDELRELMEAHYEMKMCHLIEQALNLRFPNIQGLNVKLDDKKNCIISFSETEYTKEEVSKFWDQLKGNPLSIKLDQ